MESFDDTAGDGGVDLPDGDQSACDAAAGRTGRTMERSVAGRNHNCFVRDGGAVDSQEYVR